jgi:hypothetical protein
MRRTVILLAYVMLISNVNGTDLPNNTIVVDFAHARVGHPEGKRGSSYSLSPCREFTIDTRNIDFSKGMYPNVKPNALHVIISNNRRYTADLNSSGLTRLALMTLMPTLNSIPFYGLRSGDSIMIMIGRETGEKVKGEFVLTTIWIGMVYVE